MQTQLALCGGVKTVYYPYPKYPVIDHEEVNAAVRVVMSGFLSDCGRGAYVAEMEDAFAAYFGSKYALGFSSGTGAIHGALFAVGVRPGDEVLTANHNWISGITAIMHAGGTPILCDVKPGAFHIDPAEIRRKATANTKAVIVTHLWGLPADMDAVLDAAAAMHLPVIEDCSHAHGGMYKGRYLGTIGDVGCFSLQGSKAIVAGEGGVLLTNSERYYQRAQVPGHHGARLSGTMTLDDVAPFAAGGGVWTYRIATVAAAIATAQLKKLDTLNAARQANFDRLYAQIRDLPFITWPHLDEESKRGWYGTPACYDASKACGVPRDLFVKACQAEGAAINGEGYCDWSQIPVFQHLELYSQLFTAQHVNGVTYKPIAAGSLPHNDLLRQTMMLFVIPAVEVPVLMDQVAAAMHKVADNLDSLKDYPPAEVPA